MSNINEKASEISADSYSDKQAQIDSTLLDLHTSLPALVISYDPEARTIKAQPTIKRVFSEGEGIQGAQDLPPCVDVPVVFPMGGGFEITFPISSGDECLLIFSERCIDGWFETGETSKPNDYRQHDLSDAFALVGVRSLKNKLSAWNEGLEIKGKGNHIRISSDSIELQSGGAVLKLTDSALSCNVPIQAPNLITNNFDVNAHYHGNVRSGSDKSGIGED